VSSRLRHTSTASATMIAGQLVQLASSSGRAPGRSHSTDWAASSATKASAAASGGRGQAR
jgi:hypothetical protein